MKGHRILLIGLIVAGAFLVLELLLAARKNNKGQQPATNSSTAATASGQNQQPIYLIDGASNYTSRTEYQDSFNQTNSHNDGDSGGNGDPHGPPSHIPPPGPPVSPPPSHFPPPGPPISPPPQPPPTVGPPGGHGPPPQPPPSYQHYTVRSGDTLTKIASMFGVDWQSIYQTNRNNIDSTAKAHGRTSNFFNWIWPGETLLIPQ